MVKFIDVFNYSTQGTLPVLCRNDYLMIHNLLLIIN